MSAVKLPDAPSVARNREAIFTHLQRLLSGEQRLLEIGSGTGQHAVYFSGLLPRVTWQTSERRQKLHEVHAWLESRPAANLPPPLELDVCADWPQRMFDTIFTANTLHIMSAQTVQVFFKKMPEALKPGGLLIVYGPVKMAGEFIGSSNGEFDLWLKQRDPQSGIRDLEWLDQLARQAGLSRLENNNLPANNQLLVWQKKQDSKEL